MLRKVAGVSWYRCLNSFMKCDILVNAHSLPISDIVRLVEVSIMRARSRRCAMIHLWGGALNIRLNSFLNEVRERFVIVAKSSMEISL